jgi:nucleoside-diphosphate-sugar epimerase
MKIRVTGGVRFLGPHLSEFLLQKGHSVLTIDGLNDFKSLHQNERI